MARRRHTSTHVTFWRLFEAILPVLGTKSGAVNPAMVARTNVNGAFVIKDICMQTERRRR